MADDVYEMPVSFAQRWMWLLDQLDPEGPAYLVPWRVTITGPLDRAALSAALSTVVGRHEALRTAFRSTGGPAPVQVVGPAEVPIEVVDVSGEPDPAAAAERLALDHARRPFRLDAGPLLRATLLAVAPDRHELLLVMHHIVGDGWSAGLMFGEIAAAYEAAVAGTEPRLPELPIQYGDFAMWQADQWAAGAYRGDEDFWRDALSGAPTTPPVPTDHPRPSRQEYTGAVLSFRLDSEITDGLRAVARAAGATLFGTLLALYATVIGRYAGRGDLVIGSPVSGRTQAETEHLIGLFTNTVPLRMRLDGDPTFVDLVERARAVTVAALAHQELPFDRIVELVAPDRSLAHAPLVQVLLALEEMPAAVTAGGATFAPELVENDTAKLDLALGVSDRGSHLDARLNYDTALFDEQTARQIADSLLTVARAVVADPHRPISRIDLMSPETLATVRSWGTGAALDTRTDLVDLLAGALADDPEAPAVEGPDGVLSRGRVLEWAGQIAAGLAAAGIGPESTVGLCLPRGAALVPAMLGVWLAGAAYVPIDPGYPSERLKAMVADAGVTVVLAPSALAGLVRGLVGTGVSVVRTDAPDIRAATPLAPVAVAPQALAYTIFTSGSTGRPKGVAVPRGAVEAMLRAFREALPLGRDDVLVAVTTLSFDIAVLELLLPLVCGARVVVADAQTAADGAALRALLRSSRATALQATPATWRMLAASGGVPASVRLRLCGGEALPPDLVATLTDRAQAWNVYGPTETTVWSAAGPVAPPPAPVEVGPPIAGTRIMVLDEALRPVPPGVVGEVYIAGAGVARGYHGRPGLTAERFLPEPGAPEPGARMYSTGDLARWRRNGRLDLLGRVDHQVKVRGFRIETGEIEAVLDTHESVAHSVVTAYVPAGATEAASLVAYVVPEMAPVEPATLKRHLQAHLPDYMIPGLFMSLPELPLTLNGKVDRARLPEPVWTDDSAVAHIPPRTPTEVALAGIWSQVLPGSPNVGLADNFFALGGHSLTATQMLARVQTTLGVRVGLRTLFAHTTVADLAQVIDEMRGDAEKAGADQTDSGLKAINALDNVDIEDLLGSYGI